MGEFSSNLVTKADLETGTIYTEQRDKWCLSSVPPMKVEPRPRSRTRLRSDKCYWLAFSGSRCHERIVAQCRHRRHGVQNERINRQSLLSAALSGGSYVYPKAIPCLYRESPYAKGLAGGPVRRSLPDLSRLLARRPTVTSVCQKTPLSELSCHDPPHFPRQLQPNFVQEDASDRSGWGDWWWTGPDLRDAAIGRRSRLLGSGFKG